MIDGAGSCVCLEGMTDQTGDPLRRRVDLILESSPTNTVSSLDMTLSLHPSIPMQVQC